MSRKQRHSRSSRTKHQDRTDSMTPFTSDEVSANKLPSRRKKFPSSIHKLNRWYYNLLFVLFVCLVAFLFWYGIRFS